MNASDELITRVSQRMFADLTARHSRGENVNVQVALRDAIAAGVEMVRPRRRVGLTPAQTELLMFIRDYIETNGFPPSFDEMRDGMGLNSKSGVHRLVTGLEERGAIERMQNRARAIVVLAA